MDYVLVHGQTQSPAGWDPLVAELERRGHRAFAVDLPTDRPDAVAEEYATVVTAQVTPLGWERPVVVAHSGSGNLLPAIGRALDARHLVWLAAAVPDFTGGRSWKDQISDRSFPVGEDEWFGWREPLTDTALAAYFLFHDCDADGLRRAIPTLRLFVPRAALLATPDEAAPTTPSTYVLPDADRTLRPQWMAAVARDRLGLEPVVMPGVGHCPYSSAPESLAMILDKIE